MRCTTCGRPAQDPTRQTFNHKVVEGCVDLAHEAYADEWHTRPEARAIQARQTWDHAAITAAREICQTRVLQ
jgi:hypothetical protein